MGGPTLGRNAGRGAGDVTHANRNTPQAGPSTCRRERMGASHRSRGPMQFTGG